MQYQTINPATEEVVKTFPSITDAELESVVGQAHTCYQNDWSQRTIAERAKVIAAAANILKQKAEEYAGYVTLEMGKLFTHAVAEVRLTVGILEYYAQNAEAFLAPKQVPGFPNAEVQKRPLGVLLAVEPWNFPYYQVARVVGPQLMAGNTVVLKHAECVPQSALAFARLMVEAGAPAGAFSNVFATHDQIAKVIADPRIVGVTVTGSERAGSAIAAQAGKHLKKVVTELGGTDAMIVLPDAPVEAVIGGALFGRFFNAGQSCISVKRIIVVGKERGEAITKVLTAKVSGIKLGDPRDATTQVGPVSSERAMKTLLDQIEQARKGGAKILTGGGRPEQPGFFVQPTVITGITADNPVYRQELFGPVACVYVVDSVDEAVRLANDSPYGLGGSVYGADVEQAKAVAERIETGMVFVNQATWTTAQLPFGGVKNSGFGRELAELGIGEFVNHKLVHLAPAGSPPYGPVDFKPAAKTGS